MKFAPFAAAVAVAVVLSAGVEAEAGLFGCHKKKACCESAPTCCEPEPTCCEPVVETCCEPVVEEAPCCEPAPTCCEPAPTCCEPEPCCEPDPCCKPKRCGFFARIKAKHAAKHCCH